jgi:LysR family glycine cleavage system transcriptional activator
MVRTPNFNALKMFDAAARHLNFRLAAEELNLTQGAVAQQVRRLEADLGLVLFHRKARGLALTDIGQSYHRPVRRALAIIEDATQKLRPQTTRITLSVTPSLASKWLVPRLGPFSGAYPDIDVQTVASEGLANFRGDGVEIAIRLGHPPFGDALRAELLSPLDLTAVCSPNYVDKSHPIEQFADLANHPLIQDGHNHWDRMLENEGLSAQHRIKQFNQTALAMDAAATGQGITLAPRLLARDDIIAGKLVEVWSDNQSDERGFYVICPIKQKPNPSRDIVIDWLLSDARSS